MKKIIALLTASLALGPLGVFGSDHPYARQYSIYDPGTDNQAFAGQGSSVATDGSIVVVGAASDSQGEPYAGVAKIYEANTGLLVHTLTNPSPSYQGRFGISVSVAGTVVVVGAPGNTADGVLAGSAYVYDLAGAAPTLPVLTLTNPSPAPHGSFGWSVANSGSRVVIGAYGDFLESGTVKPGGRVYVYDLTSVAPQVPVITLTNPIAWYDDFGKDIAILGNRLVVGVPDASVYVYDLGAASPSVPVATLNDPDPSDGDYFGSQVAIFNTRVVVGAPYDDAGGIRSAGSAFVYDLASPSAPLLTLTNPSPTDYDAFGSSVAISGMQVVVGAPDNFSGTEGPGNAYVFDLGGVTPAEPALILTNTNSFASDAFGTSVALSGTRLVVGSPGDDTMATHAGSAYVYELAGANPSQPGAALNQPSIAVDHRFGCAVGISGTRLVVGAFGEDAGGVESSGIAYVYDISSAAPTLPVLTLTNPSPWWYDGFGSALAISDVLAVVAAPRKSTVYVYDFESPAPSLPILTLTNPSPQWYLPFGSALSLSGSLLVIGVRGENTEAERGGRAYVYDLASSTPSLPWLSLTNPSPARFDGFGGAVSVSGARVVVGATGDDTGAPFAGSAYVYDLASTTPGIPAITLTNPSPDFGDGFGWTASVSGNYVVVGVPGEGTGADDTGGVYVYDLTSPTPTSPVAFLGNPTPSSLDRFGEPLAISGKTVVAGGYWGGASSPQETGAYVYDLMSATPAVPVATLSNPNPSGFNHFGSAVAVDGSTILVGASGDDTLARDRGAVFVFGLSNQPPTDVDGDGVLDLVDQCPGTPAGSVVDATGCSVAQLVPCEGPASGGKWKNHGQYVRAVLQTATDFLKSGLITRRQLVQIVKDAAHSKCGWNRKADCEEDWHWLRPRNGDQDRNRERDDDRNRPEDGNRGKGRPGDRD